MSYPFVLGLFVKHKQNMNTLFCMNDKVVRWMVKNLIFDRAVDRVFGRVFKDSGNTFSAEVLNKLTDLL